MKIRFDYAGRECCADLSQGISIAIDLDFDGIQPVYFGAAKASRQRLMLDGFVGSVEEGGSCNIDCMTLIPHCNTTHTETVGHIVKSSVPIGKVFANLKFAQVFSLTAQTAAKTNDHYQPELQRDDHVIDRNQLESCWVEQAVESSIEALIIRTLPNDRSKCETSYTLDSPPPFFTIEAIQWINQMGIQHLIVDLPSIDRMHDEGRLTSHHQFWNVTPGRTTIDRSVLAEKTITEMAYIPNDVADGVYLLDLQVPAIISDAAPSRPILYAFEQLEN